MNTFSAVTGPVPRKTPPSSLKEATSWMPWTNTSGCWMSTSAGRFTNATLSPVSTTQPPTVNE
ncbi:MAG: hypothetical protein IPG04_14550 [Polyangiaceae bacterium]|nr:hypothetical protein [Polyangiaceae bacterium]